MEIWVGYSTLGLVVNALMPHLVTNTKFPWNYHQRQRANFEWFNLLF
jgi:hypothetical protein